jgi:biopolymer transport protein ExbD
MALTHTRTRKFVTPAGHPNSDINMTPLVDVVLVLLIIFMVLTPLLEKDITVRVPQVEKLTDPSVIPPDQLIVAISADGELTINNQKVPESEYTGRLQRLLESKGSGDKVVFFTPDEKASFAKVVMALDGAKQAGAETLGMTTEITLPPEVAPPGQPPGEMAPSPPSAPTTPPQ